MDTGRPSLMSGRLAGIDFGSKRVGIALSDETRQFALPKGVLKNDSELFNNFRSFCKENNVVLVVMGESRDYKGKDNKIMEEARLFAEKVKKELVLDVAFVPEFLTSAEAERIQGKIDTLDASAAAIILKSYIDQHYGN
jgi:putative Holliday junction resolvase